MLSLSVWSSLVLITGILSICSSASSSPADQDTLQIDTSDATALIILDEQKFEIKNKREAYWDLHIRKRILQYGHPEEWTFSFSEDRDHEILSIEGKAVYPDGKERFIDKDDIEILPIYEDFILYSDQKSRAFMFVGIKPGTEIAVRVRYRIRNLVYWNPVVFQNNKPILKKSYALIHPGDIDIAIRGVNMDVEPDRRHNDKDGRRVLVWERFAIEAFERENRMPPMEQYLPSLWFSILEDQKLGKKINLATWSGIVDWYLELTRKGLKPGSGVKRMAAGRGKTDIETAAAIYSRVQDELRYVAILLGMGGYIPHSCEETLKNRYGDCKDQSTVLAAALREAGIGSYLVMVRTADLGRLEDPAPTPGYFNHVIVAAEIDGETIFLDPTCSTCSYGVLPHNIQGAHALVARRGENGLTTLPVGQAQGNARSIHSGISIDSQGTATVVDTMVFEGTYASMYRWSFGNRSGKSPEELVEDLFLEHYPLAAVESVELQGMDQAAEKLMLLCRSTIPGFVKPRSTVFINPLIYRFDFGARQREERRYPFDMGLARLNRYRVTLVIPADLEVKSKPEPLEIRNGHFSYMGRWKENDTGLTFDRVMEISDGLVYPAGYDTVSVQLDEISKLESAKVVIRKVKP